MEAQTGMANNPFLVALHNARGQRTRERKRATVLVKENKKMTTKCGQRVRLKDRESSKERYRQRVKSDQMYVWKEGEFSTQTEKGPVACSAHSCPLAEWGSNRAFCLQHKDVANVCVSSTH